MLQFNRKTEYALIALEHMIFREKEEAHVASAREIAEAYVIPYPVLAKVLQRLAGRGLVKSVHGTNGGYVLAKAPQDISLADVVEVFEGSLAVADCFKEEKITCPQWGGCLIRHPLYSLNHKIYQLLTKTTVADMAAENF